MIINGKKIAEAIFSDVAKTLQTNKSHPCLAVFACNPNAETRKYLELKKKRAAEAGIDVAMLELDQMVDIDDAVNAIKAVIGKCEGIIVQLPFPAHLDVNKLLAAIPDELDVDRMHYSGEESDVLPPVMGAIVEIAKRHNVDFKGKNVVVVGRGRLVGAPAALWAEAQSAAVTVVDKSTPNAEEILKIADIIISGAGSPGLITPEKIKDGVIIFDASTSEEGGQMRGDAAPACADKASLFTPVPGGIGPITIAVLLRNLVLLTKNSKT